VSISDGLSARARLRFSILTLFAAVIIALFAIHVYSLSGGVLDGTGSRARTLGGAIQVYLIEPSHRDLLPNDSGLQRLLDASIRQDDTISNILISDSAGALVASARPWQDEPIESWRDWRRHDPFRRFLNLLTTDRDIAFDVTQQPESPFTVRVLYSAARLRAAVWPQLEDFALISVVSLLVSLFLATVVSSLVGDSLDRIGHQIDRISGGDTKSIDRDDFNLPEVATLETKLFSLGHQFSGARTDILRLRSNVETMLRQLDEAVMVFGSDGRLQVVGEAAERLLGKPRQQLLGRTVNEVFPEWTGVGAVLSRALNSRQRLREQPVTLERTNLPPVSLLMTLETIDYGDGGASGVLVALRDADTRRKIRADLDTARRLSAISRITSGVGHEIKNPLNAMMLHLQIAKDKLERQADCRPALDIIGLELLRLDRVVKALLDFERPLEPVMARCDLTQVASDVAVLIGPQATAQGVRVVVEPYADGAFIDADADLFKQALLNVAVNGLEAMPSGGLLQFRVEWSGSEYFVSVCDDGPGIPPEIRDKIFNLYFTTKKAGTGVGLAMTYRIMLLNGGTITVESDVGKGSCFRLGFPAPSVTRQEETEPTGTPLTYS
jgi:PAS domain S-box-containing protein